MNKHWLRCWPLLVALCLVVSAGVAFAEDYLLGPEDVVTVSVWMHPELDRVLTINADGNVTLPPVGDIKAAALTPKQLGDRMADRLSSYLRQTTTVTVTVTQYMSRSVFVSGGVAKPGRYGFERIPTLIDVLGQAGGALPGVDLSSVQIVRKEGAARRTIPADLSNALRTGDPSGLPELKPGDTVMVPGAAAQGAANPNDGVGVLGEVNKPGLYAINTGQDVWSVLAAAGGLTARGSLKDVRLLSRSDSGLNVTALNLQDVLAHGSPSRTLVKPGDVVVVMSHGPGAFTVLVNVLGLSRDALNAALLVDYFQNRNNNNNNAN